LVPISIRRGLVVNLVAIPLRLVVNLVSRIWGLNGAYESNHFLEQTSKIMMTPTCNKTMKAKRLKEGGFCGFFWGFYFVVGPFF